jgi:predicted amidohydrolase YtcJ
LDEMNSIHEAMAIKDGKIIEVGPERQILNKYWADETKDAKKADVYPGFTDAHTHLFSLAKQNLGVNLVDCSSMQELVSRIKVYIKKTKRTFVIGRGWDQTRWKDSRMPTNEMLNLYFPDIPVALYRIDGHAMLVNQAIIDLMDKKSPLITEGGYETGLFIDNDMSIPESKLKDYSNDEYRQELLKIQAQLYAFGVTGVHEAGILQWQSRLLQKMVEENRLQLNIYAMLSANEENFKWAMKHGKFENKNLTIRSFKLYMDGALGSRGALLKSPYSDRENYSGIQLTSNQAFQMWIDRMLQIDYQLNVHAIGDRGNEIVLLGLKRVFEQKPDHRWRIEHAQVVDPNDFHYFGDYAVFPSVQPTHAISDHDWAALRIGPKRMKGAYAYRSLYEQFGMLALGTDFPVESINPFLTLRAAVLRCDENNKPIQGFMNDETLSFELAMKGMTIWPQFASFQENKRGMLIKGMEATFFISERALNEKSIPAENRAISTYIKGREVYDSNKY